MEFREWSTHLRQDYNIECLTLHINMFELDSKSWNMFHLGKQVKSSKKVLRNIYTYFEKHSSNVGVYHQSLLSCTIKEIGLDSNTIAPITY